MNHIVYEQSDDFDANNLLLFISKNMLEEVEN